MNKRLSFFVSAMLAASLLILLIVDQKQYTFNIDWATPFLIYWYMIWKLFHDKNKD